VAEGTDDLSLTAQLAVIADDVEAQAGAGEAKQAVLLVLLASDIKSGNSEIGSSFSPVAVTPDELGEGDLSLVVRRNGKSLESGKATGKDCAGAVAVAAAKRPLIAGSIVATSSSLVSSALSLGDVVRIEMNDRTGHSIFGAIEQTVETRSK
jgi:fumarylacetoacetate (FAA) hydrolase